MGGGGGTGLARSRAGQAGSRHCIQGGGQSEAAGGYRRGMSRANCRHYIQGGGRAEANSMLAVGGCSRGTCWAGEGNCCCCQTLLAGRIGGWVMRDLGRGLLSSDWNGRDGCFKTPSDLAAQIPEPDLASSEMPFENIQWVFARNKAQVAMETEEAPP